jgi:hypothetical protein
MNFRSRVIPTAVATLAFGLSTSAQAAANLVPNGSFESGNTQFTSDYAFTPGGNSTEGQYTVRTNPFPWNGAFVSIGDHTSGTGQMMVVNGSPVSGAVVWKSDAISVGASTSYFFEAFVNNVCCSTLNFGPGSESILEFSLSFDGDAAESLGTIATDLDLAGTWEGLSTQWVSSAAGSVVLSLVNRNTNRGGNDFAIDDVYFGTRSIVNPPPIPEPSTWALMGLGLVGVGAAVRRQRAPRG